jgi:2-polyprenyl-3-methyl-5-hydroxy-6-metoxy-1,4-benzoquinol methylase
MRRTSTSKTRVGFRDHYEELYSRISESDLLTARDPLLRFRVSERILLIKRFLIDASACTKGCCLLDLGCAEGFLFPYVINLGYTYIAVDIARVNLLKVRKSGATYLVQADAEHLPFRNQSFYIIICTEVLEHLENPLAALREISRVGKYALISTPLVGCPFIVDSLIANRRAMFLTLRSRL